MQSAGLRCVLLQLNLKLSGTKTDKLDRIQEYINLYDPPAITPTPVITSPPPPSTLPPLIPTPTSSSVSTPTLLPESITTSDPNSQCVGPRSRYVSTSRTGRVRRRPRFHDEIM